MSTSERMQNVLVGASELPPERRAAYLDSACRGDAALRAEVESLLESHDDAGRFMADPTVDVPLGSGSASGGSRAEFTPTIIAAPREREGQMIGRYKLLQLIGEGGFGSVWMAEQREPVKRRVALKVIKLGMDTHQVIARFEAERQALAMMDHPNIAKVLDAGSTETGRPYFVMEYIKGVPICEYCDTAKLDTRARLGLFSSVCHAIQHAHQKGIIHRDIKPSNVLVTMHDGVAVPKVIDFGIAKATSSELTQKTLFTEHRQMIGTPAYMSPEQAEMSGLDIDTRSDIYSLGVLLYELLTGTTPFDSKSLVEAGFAEMMRIIREVEPHKPSTRLSSLGDAGTRTAQQRHVGDPTKLSTILKGDLDWIVMKCLEKDRTRRYETANGLAADIQRHLNDETVTAGAPGAGYKLRKFVRRHRSKVIAGGIVAAALVLGLAGTIWQASVASEQRDRARSEAARAVAAEAETRRRAEELQRVADFQGQMLAQVDPTTAGARLSEDVRARFDAAIVKAGVPDNERAAQVDQFVGQWSRVNATDTALELIDRTILKPAVAAIDTQFAAQPTVAATLRHVLAERYHDLGLDSAALALEQQALSERQRVLGEDHPDTLLSVGNLGVYLNGMGKNKEAEAYYREALEKSRRVRGDDHPETMVCISNLGSMLIENGKLSEAEPYCREALERRRRVLGEDDPDTLRSISMWGTLLKEQGKLSEAEPFYREALAKRRRVLGEEHFNTLSSINDLGTLLRSQGKLDEAIQCFREVTEKKRRTLGEMHPSTLTSIQNLGAVLDAGGRPEEAEALMREALTKQQQLLGADHTSTLTTMGNLAVYLINRDKFAAAEPLCRETLERRKRVLGVNHSATLIANNVMGLVLVRQGKLSEGEPYWREALTISRHVLGPAHPETLVYIHNLAGLAVDQKKPAEAEQLYREVVQAGGPAIGVGHPTVLSATRRLGALLLEQGRYAEAVDLLSTAEPPARTSYTGSTERYLGVFLRDLGAARTGLAQFAAAEANLVEAQAIVVKALGEKHKDTRECARALADCYAAWDKAEPGKGHGVKAAEWKAKFDAIAAPPGAEPAKPPGG